MKPKITVLIAAAVRRPGQTKGEGSQAFGAGWDALSLSGRTIESDD
jgi:hypothetical protein